MLQVAAIWECTLGTVKVAATGAFHTLSVEEAADHIFKQIKNNKDAIDRWSRENHNDKSSIAQLNDRICKLYAKGKLAEGFDKMRAEATSEAHGLKWHYALAALNLRLSSYARATQLERELMEVRGRSWSLFAKRVSRIDAMAGQRVRGHGRLLNGMRPTRKAMGKLDTPR